MTIGVSDWGSHLFLGVSDWESLFGGVTRAYDTDITKSSLGRVCNSNRLYTKGILPDLCHRYYSGALLRTVQIKMIRNCVIMIFGVIALECLSRVWVENVCDY